MLVREILGCASTAIQVCDCGQRANDPTYQSCTNRIENCVIRSLCWPYYREQGPIADIGHCARLKPLSCCWLALVERRPVEERRMSRKRDTDGSRFCSSDEAEVRGALASVRLLEDNRQVLETEPRCCCRKNQDS